MEGDDGGRSRAITSFRREAVSCAVLFIKTKQNTLITAASMERMLPSVRRGPREGGEELLDELSLAAECSEPAKQLLTLAGKHRKHTRAHARARTHA